MTARRLTDIGFVVKPHGYGGNVVIRLTSDHGKEIVSAESLFLLVEGRAVPFMVEAIEQVRNDSLIVSFRHYDSAGKVAGFTGCRVQAELKGSVGKKRYEDLTLTGFTLLDSDGRVRGVIRSISERKHQWLATVENQSGAEFLLPVHEDLIIEADPKGKTITMTIPDGIEDIG
jgi:16S rRNA processing protein RimM